MIELTQVRDRRGRYKHSAVYNWRKKKNRAWSDYQPYCVAIFGLITWLIFAQIIPVYAHITNESGYREILNSYRDPLKVPSTVEARIKGNDEPVSADSESLPRESEDGGTDAVPTPSSSVEEKILKAWEGTGEGHIALAVAKAESGLKPQNIGDLNIVYWENGKQYGMSVGLFQIRILPGRPDIQTLLNEDNNIEYARKLYDRSGFTPWSVYKNNSYLKHL